MAESIGKIKCPFSGCSEVAELKTDKRKKKYITCPVHGRIPFNTNKAQAEIQRLIDAGEASEDIGGVVVGLEPTVNPVPEKVDIPENEKEKGGILFIVIGVLIGVGSWLLKKTTR